jgi:hypothetical protein
MKFIIISFVSLLSVSAFARFDLNYSRTGSESNFSNIVSLGYSLNTLVDEESSEVGLNHYLGYVFSDGYSLSSLNASLSDFEILTKTHELSYSMTFSEALTLTMNSGFSQYNDKESRSDSFGVGVYYQFEKTQVGYDYGESLFKQLKQAIVLTQDVTERARFKQKVHSIYIDYQWTENFLVKFAAASYSYQLFGNVADMDALTTAVTLIPFLNTGGPSLAEQSYGQIKNSTDLGFLYNFSDNWLFELGLQSSTEQLVSNAKTNGASIGLEYTNSINSMDYTISGSLTSSKTENVDGNSVSALFGAGISF